MKIENSGIIKPIITYRRDWSKYSTELLLQELSSISFEFEIDDIQEHWNILEEIIVKTTDKVTPVKEFTNNVTTSSLILPTYCI